MNGSNENCKWHAQGADHNNGLDNLGKSKSTTNYMYNLPLSTVVLIHHNYIDTPNTISHQLIATKH